MAMFLKQTILTLCRLRWSVGMLTEGRMIGIGCKLHKSKVPIVALFNNQGKLRARNKIG